MELSRLSPKIPEYFLSVLKVDNNCNVHDYDELKEINSADILLLMFYLMSENKFHNT